MLASHRKDALRSLRRLARSPFSTLLTALVVGISLLLPALLILLYSNLGQVLGEFQDSARISLFLKAEVSEAEGITVSNDLLSDERIELAAYISASQALAEFSAASGFSDSLDQLPSNPLPATVIVRPAAAAIDSVDQLAEELRLLPQVEFAQLDSQWIGRLQAISELLAVMARLLGVIIVAGLCLVVGNTIKLSIDDRREEIRVLKLVGATNTFIARPFLYSGLYFGLIGGALACGLVVAVVLGTKEALTDLVGLYNGGFQFDGPGPLSVAGLLVSGALIGWLAALLASLRHIAAIDP